MGAPYFQLRELETDAGLQRATREQMMLDFDEVMPENRVRLMDAMDKVNQRYGRGTLKLASAGTPKAIKQWAMKQERISSGFTTDWEGLAVVGWGIDSER